jgi:phosphatidylserine/phosphatidylglycerophosphate/cardiolipin synthase-like enzyme
MDLERTPFVWAAAAVLVDQPAKIPADGAAAGSVPNGSAPALAPSSPPSLAASPPAGEPGPLNAPSSPKAAAAALVSGSRKVPAADSAPGAQPRADTNEAQTDTVVDGLLQLMGQARRDLLIISPYFVPGPDMEAAFAAARARGVRVRVLTNSLASNDAPIAHAGYARHRPQLLAMGVELYEMHSELPGVLRGALGVSGSMGNHSAGVVGSQGGSRAMLHSKLLIVDGRLLVVGSMNLDMRSQRQNTEVALLIRSTELSRRATTQIDTALKESAWQVQTTDQGLRWRAPEGSGLPDATTEPDASAPLRLMLQLLGPLAPDHLL